ncbi:membrane protein insertase YidC [Dokdonella koreensis]|uniref:Membrane protein insertase YidC n=1 Tax=Dokdonella koreensis DS-123 TaxID=1300342 RepID=A0A161HS30_9GAMM|nr:membrane protein insertase YidC [Dokdonella koreensis]ANB19807.1 Inner membrane protein translocase component YidC [Dokdonella koreensis DS-123]
MTSPRPFLLLALLLLGYLLWEQWRTDYGQPSPPPAPAVAVEDTVPAATVPGDTPVAATAPGDVPVTAQPEPAAAGQRIVVTTDVLRVEIDTRGGSVVVADLLAYPKQPKQPEPVRLLDDSTTGYFVANSGLVSAQGAPAAPDHNAVFSAAATDYAFAAGQERIEVPLTWQGESGLTVSKVYTFERGSYVIGQRQEIRNAGAAPWTGNAYRELRRVPLVVDTRGLKGYTNPEQYSFTGAAWYSPQHKFQKFAFDKFKNDPVNIGVVPLPEGERWAWRDWWLKRVKVPADAGWIAQVQHYFFAAWIPSGNEASEFSRAELPNPAGTRYLIRAVAPSTTVAPGETRVLDARLYVGPKLQSTLDDIAPGLSLTANYGIFTFISAPLHWVLDKLHALTGNWGFAIILLVLLIKAGFYKLSEAQYRSMARMRKVAPRMQALKERYGDDRQKLNQAMLEMYQKEKINPLGGCLPMLIQIPVFFALYWVLIESVELRQAPFIGWIQNLSAPDPYFVLPILNAAAMLLTQHLTPMTGMDPTQAKIMKFMPVAFSVLFAFFPAGLVLYWATNAILSLIQQYIITKRVEAGETAKPAKG